MAARRYAASSARLFRIAISIAALGFLAPQTQIWTIAYLAAVVAFFSASLDIAMDAYRREILPDAELGLGNSFYVNAYRISSLVPGSAEAVRSLREQMDLEDAERAMDDQRPGVVLWQSGPEQVH